MIIGSPKPLGLTADWTIMKKSFTLLGTNVDCEVEVSSEQVSIHRLGAPEPVGVGSTEESAVHDLESKLQRDVIANVMTPRGRVIVANVTQKLGTDDAPGT